MMDTMLNKFKRYMIALRPWSFSASFTPVLLGSALAYKDIYRFKLEHNFSNLVFILCSLIAICVHGAGNLVNTYYDFKNGIDKNNKSSDRTLVDGLLKPQDITRLGVALYTIGSLGFLLLISLSPATEFALTVIYFGGLSLSFMYTGGIGFKYMALGDLIIVITFGPITVLFAYISQTGIPNDSNWIYWLIKPLLYAIPLVMNTESILHSNNARDCLSDNESGIVTIAILLGYTGSYLLFVILLFVPYLLFLAMSIKLSVYYLAPIFTLPIAFKLEKQFRLNNLNKIPKKTAQLNLYFGLLYVLACFVSR